LFYPWTFRSSESLNFLSINSRNSLSFKPQKAFSLLNISLPYFYHLKFIYSKIENCLSVLRETFDTTTIWILEFLEATFNILTKNNNNSRTINVECKVWTFKIAFEDCSRMFELSLPEVLVSCILGGSVESSDLVG